MNRAYLAFFAVIAAGCPLSADAQVRPLTVCEALTSVRDREAIVIRAHVVSVHWTELLEGTGEDPCPGWPRRFFTAPSAMPLLWGSIFGVHVSEAVLHDCIEFGVRLHKLQKEDPSNRRAVTVNGVLMRKRWPVIFMAHDGTYCCWGLGPDGGYAALLVVTSAPSPLNY
jgi:hypothetical protein